MALVENPAGSGLYVVDNSGDSLGGGFNKAILFDRTAPEGQKIRGDAKAEILFHVINNIPPGGDYISRIEWDAVGNKLVIYAINATTLQEYVLAEPVLPPIKGDTGPAGGVNKVNGRQGDVTLDKTDVGLSNVDNTSDASKPISTSTQAALNGKEPTLAAGTNTQYYRGDKTWATHDKASVGLGNVDNTADTAKPVSTATQTALNAKENTVTAGTSAQYYRGDKTWQTLNKSAVGLGNVDNTADIAKPVSTAQQSALDLKQNTSAKNVANGYAGLDATGLIPSTLLPSYVDDVLEFANLAAFPATGEAGKIYTAIDTARIYRWSGSVYTEISPSPGSTDSVPEGGVNLYYTQARADARAAAALAARTITAGTGLTGGGTLAADRSFAVTYGTAAGTACQGNDSRLSDTRTPTDNTVSTAKIQDGAVTSAKIADGTIATADIADGAITTAKILDGTIATADIADGAINSAKILDGTIATADIADGAINSAKILDGTIVDGDISASAAISKSKLASAVQTSLGLADSAVQPASLTSAIATAQQVAQNAQTGAYTLVASDANKAVEVTAATDTLITVPTNATVPFPIGTIIELTQCGAGGVIANSASGVTINTPAGWKTRTQWSTMILRKRGTDTWLLSGDIQ